MFTIYLTILLQFSCNLQLLEGCLSKKFLFFAVIANVLPVSTSTFDYYLVGNMVWKFVPLIMAMFLSLGELNTAIKFYKRFTWFKTYKLYGNKNEHVHFD